MSDSTIEYGLGKYKGEWQPLTDYRAYDLVHDGVSLWVANADFTSGATFDEVNWTCPSCSGGV